ncbi:hypothetical protein BKA15_002033 [Microlunatus parietis]|uniref:Uncharacterized protein n=1 Tax=Microlunatus parietis TaxID=682979 RepID=A0A7Y9I5M6_9ACTN|nr:hypothetical protein [Microlunatus parietis]NYE70704.1 hypothetical protein [Microlunatus parietis]
MPWTAGPRPVVLAGVVQPGDELDQLSGQPQVGAARRHLQPFRQAGDPADRLRIGVDLVEQMDGEVVGGLADHRSRIDRQPAARRLQDIPRVEVAVQDQLGRRRRRQLVEELAAVPVQGRPEPVRALTQPDRLAVRDLREQRELEVGRW